MAEQQYTYQRLVATYGAIPDAYIPFTEESQLWMPYSAKSVCPEALEVDHSLAKQLRAHTSYLINPPLGGVSSMAGVDEETASMRNRTLCQVVGFAHHYLGLEPSLAVIQVGAWTCSQFDTVWLALHPPPTPPPCVQDPVVVAGVCGFWEARGLAPMTIKLRVQHITQGTSFVDTRYCPKGPGAQRVGVATQAQLQAWFKRLSAYALAEADRQPKRLYNVELWEAWDFAIQEFVGFMVQFKVGSQTPVLACITLPTPKPLTPLHLTPHRPTTASGRGPWHRSARWWC